MESPCQPSQLPCCRLQLRRPTQLIHTKAFTWQRSLREHPASSSACVVEKQRFEPTILIAEQNLENLEQAQMRMSQAWPPTIPDVLFQLAQGASNELSDLTFGIHGEHTRLLLRCRESVCSPICLLDLLCCLLL